MDAAQRRLPSAERVYGLRRFSVTARTGWALVAITAVAAIARFVLYLSDRSLTLDESFLALNVDRRSAADLVGRLDWNSAAPFAFLELEKSMTAVFGDSEHVLRTLPFVASIGSLFVFVALARRVTSPPAAVVASAMFAVSALTISYAALAKPYSLDVLFVMLLQLATLRTLSSPGARRDLLVLGVLGAIAPALSYASVFAVGASAVVLIAAALRANQRSALVPRLALVGGWLALALGWYLWHGGTVRHLQRSFGDEYLESWSSIRDALGAVRILLGISASNAQLGVFTSAIVSLAAVAFLVVGVVRLLRRDLPVAATLLLPAAGAAAAALARVYPLTPRTLLFIGPPLIICIAIGIVDVWRRVHGPLFRVLVVALAAAILVSEISAGIRALAPVRRDDGMKPIMAVLAAHQRAGDTVYLSYASQYPFAYYLACKCAGSTDRAARRGLWDVEPRDGSPAQFAPALRSTSRRFVLGSFRGYRLESYSYDLERLRNRGRVWIITTFLHQHERDELRLRLDRLGTRVASYSSAKGVDAVTADLYDF
jgi:Dolichyl-phosphate-mannose-protein mannosyltransferase